MRRFILLPALLAVISGCAYLMPGLDPLADADRFAADKKYPEAIAAYDKAAKASPLSDKGAYALFASAITRAFYDNPNRDYAAAFHKFDEFLRLYPDHEKASEARNWRSALKTMMDLRKENDQLNKSIQQLKSIDIKHEERRKGSTRK